MNLYRITILLVLSIFVGVSGDGITYVARASSPVTIESSNAIIVDTTVATPAVRELVRNLASEDEDLRGKSACELSSMGTEALPSLSYLMGRLGDTELVNPYTCRAIDSSNNMHWHMGGGDWRTVGELSALAIVSIIEETGDREIGDRLRGHLQHSEAEARANAAMALGFMSQRNAASAIRQRLTRDPNAKVREYAAHALAALNDTGSVDQLVRSLEDDAAKVRAASAWALGTMDHKESGEAILTALNAEQSPRAREKMAWSLGVVNHQDALNALADLLADISAEVREQAAWALGLLGKPAAVGPLASALEDAEVDVRERSAWALGIIGNRMAVPALMTALESDEAAEVRNESAWALGMIGDSSAESALVKATEDADDEVRKQAVWALSNL